MDMTPEFILLGFTLILALAQVGAAAVAVTAERGAKWNAGARDGEAAPLGKVAGRLVRAQANLFETLPIFAAAVIMAHVAGKDGTLTFLGTHLYLRAARLCAALRLRRFVCPHPGLAGLGRRPGDGHRRPVRLIELK